MPFSKPLPTWNALGTKPPQAKIDGGWQPDEKPPADWFNWIWNTTYQVLQEMQTNAIHNDRIGVTLATLTSGKIPIAQLPDGTTAAKGVLQLSNATNSTSTTLAATANAVKVAYDLANGKYSKPVSGIPSADLDSSVQSSLGKADSALQSVPDGTTTTKGLVQLNNSTSSTLTTQAATANAVKQAYDLADSKETTSGAQSKANVAEANAINYAKNFGLGTSAVLLSANTDLNTLDGSGFYKGQTLTNSPDPALYWIIVHIKHADNYKVQMAFRVTTTSSPLMLIRSQHVGNWTSWEQMETVSGAQAKANATQVWKLTQDNGRIIALTDADLNTIYNSGVYYCGGSSLTNAPVQVIGTLEVFQFGATTTLQRYNTMGVSAQRIFERYASSGTWGDWIEFETTAGAQSKANAAASGVQDNLNTHQNNSTIHVTNADKTNWNAKETTSGAQSKANAVKSYVQGRPSILSGVRTNQTVSASTTTRVDFGLLSSDSQNSSGFNTTTAVYTVPESGVYLMSANVRTNTLGSSSSVELYAYKNGGAVSILDRQFTSVSTFVVASGSIAVYANAGDTLDFRVIGNQSFEVSNASKMSITQIS